MLNFNVNDFELEFLNLLDVELVDDYFVNKVTGDKYTFVECRDNSNITTSKLNYIYASPRGDTIEFKREKQEKKQAILTVDYRYYDYHHWAQETIDVDNGLITERIVGMDSDIRYTPKIPASKKISKHTSNVSARLSHYSDYILDTVFANYTEYYKTIDITEMPCSLSKIYPNAERRAVYKPYEFEDVVKSDKPYSLSIENYVLALTESINSKFKDNNSMRLFYLKMIPFLLKAFETALIVPYKYRDFYAHRLDNRKKAINHYCQGPVAQEILNDVDDMYYYLDNYFPSLDINKTREI